MTPSIVVAFLVGGAAFAILTSLIRLLIDQLSH